MKQEPHSLENRQTAEEDRLPLAEHVVRILVVGLALAYSYVLLN